MRVLLVDPEADLLPALQATLLAVPGLDLYCAPDGATAIQHAQFLGGIDVLLTEIFLEGVDGIVLRETLEQMRPDLRTVYLTRQDPGPYANFTGNAPVLPIPFEPHAVLSAFSPPPQQARPPKETIPYAHAPLSSPPTPEDPPARSTPFAPQTPTSSASRTSTPLEATPLPHASNSPMRPTENRRPVAPAVTTSEPESPQTPRSVSPARLEPGTNLGPYHILRVDGKTVWGPLFAAVHQTLGRAVHLMTLEPYRAELAELRADFLADAGAKASAGHPALLTVYEAGEIEGHTFCAIERIEAQSLQYLTKHAGALDTFWILRIGKAVSEAMLHLRREGTPHEPLGAGDVLVCEDGSIRLNNLAVGGIRAATSEREDVASIAACLRALLSGDAPLSLRFLLERAAPGHRKPLQGWQEFLEGCVECQSALERFKANSGPNPRVKAHPSPSRSAWKWGVAAVLATGAVATVFLLRLRQNPLVPEQAMIPPGQYLVAGGKRVQLEGFTIDRTEVSNRHYGRFLHWLRTHPGEATQFDHPEQPALHSHTPEGWKDMFPDMAKPEMLEEDPRWDLPVTRISWWDAFAFAKWAGRDLPTEEEWEAAGRGPRGLLFPWGDEPDPDRAHVKRIAKPGETPAAQPVQAQPDASAFGVLGLSGNVSEWTATRPDGKTALLKGGNFNAALFSLDLSTPSSLESRALHIGFRTVNRKTSVPRP